jgi:ATP-binding cassette, subfamily B, multidrug efflux pump
VQRPNWRDRRQAGPNNHGMRRAIAYLSKQGWHTVLPYLFMIVATVSQLAVPRMVRTIIDAVTRGVIANTIVPRLGEIPANFLPTILERLGTTLEQLQADYDNAGRLLVSAVIAIVVFSLLRGLFAFLQVFWAERISQGVACSPRSSACRSPTTTATRPASS